MEEKKKSWAVVIHFELDTENLDKLLFGSTSLFYEEKNQFLNMVNLKKGKRLLKEI